MTWYKLERTFSKSAWLSETAQPPWDLDDPAHPAIVAFYSFKGGVGRTTALAAAAMLLARAGRRVAVVDLDLEAPGLGSLLRALVGDGPGIVVFPAGQTNAAFLEKIARLDFEKFVAQPHNPLTQLLEQIRAAYTLDFILLDVRSGLHDLGGLSLNGASHLDVLFGLGTVQSWDGLGLVLPLLGGRSQRRAALLVHAMVTPGNRLVDCATRSV